MGFVPLGRHNPKVSELRAIALGKGENLTLVDGPKLFRDLLGKGCEPVAVFASPQQAAELSRRFPSLVERIPCYQLSLEVLERVAPTQHSQGLLAVYPIPHWPKVEGDLLLFLDRIQDPANLGALVRVAAALGADALVCSPGSADPFSPKAIRASAGCCLTFPVFSRVSWPAFRHQWAPSHQVVAAVAAGGQSALSWRPTLPMVLVLGNEGQGLDPQLAQEVQQAVTIPLQRGVESLNVAVACGILLARVRGLASGPILKEEGGSHDSPSRY